jgi:hypothetical protein
VLCPCQSNNRSPHHAPRGHSKGQPPRLPQKIEGLGPMRCDAAARGQVAPSPKSRGFKFQRAGHRLAAVMQLQAGLDREPAHRETAGDAQRILDRTVIQPDVNPCHFDGCEQTLVRKRTHRSPMLFHETSPVSGASVVGITTWVCQRQ